ncbi:MAG: hypothetical protein JXO72_05565 [Vicinamibacteria bacterium]|nr:hypothetical protein [Vicinamibacteria bacterium]
MTPANTKRRTPLGRLLGFSCQQRVFRAADYLEIDLIEAYEVSRRRIFYDEILLVTLHSAIGWSTVVVAGAIGGIAGLVSVGLLTVGLGAALLSFAASSLPFLVLAAWRLLVPAAVVTIFGKRARTQMRFWPLRSRGRDAYLLVSRLARERQAQVARRSARIATASPISR